MPLTIPSQLFPAGRTASPEMTVSKTKGAQVWLEVLLDPAVSSSPATAFRYGVECFNPDTGAWEERFASTFEGGPSRTPPYYLAFGLAAEANTWRDAQGAWQTYREKRLRVFLETAAPLLAGLSMKEQ